MLAKNSDSINFIAVFFFFFKKLFRFLIRSLRRWGEILLALLIGNVGDNDAARAYAETYYILYNHIFLPLLSHDRVISEKSHIYER